MVISTKAFLRLIASSCFALSDRSFSSFWRCNLSSRAARSYICHYTNNLIKTYTFLLPSHFILDSVLFLGSTQIGLSLFKEIVALSGLFARSRSRYEFDISQSLVSVRVDEGVDSDCLFSFLNNKKRNLSAVLRSEMAPLTMALVAFRSSNTRFDIFFNT